MQTARFYHDTGSGSVQCDLCRHYCRIRPGSTGLCRVRKNIDGLLYSLTWGRAVAQTADPVEKKPLYHFMPGTTTWSLGTPGCNFTCLNCQNWEISQPAAEAVEGPLIPPDQVVANAIAAGCPSLSCTYTEPTIFAEYALDMMERCRNRGLKTIWVSNGYMSPNCLESTLPLLDAANIDLKSMDDAFYRRVCGARLDPVLDNLKRIHRSGVHLEVTTLLIPGHSDSPAMLERLAGFIAEELGREVPWHVLPFYPEISWKMERNPPATGSALEAAWAIGRQAGLSHVYAGRERDDTLCPKCGAKLIERRTSAGRCPAILRLDHDGRCPSCNTDANIKN